MATAKAALDRLCDPAPESPGPVSSHYLIGLKGRIWQMVREADRAWHAGAGRWQGRDDVNSRSIGIELANTGAHPFPEPQMAALENLLRGILARHGLAPDGVIGHSDMAPGRKVDPGPRFDWQRLARQGLALCPADERFPSDGAFEDHIAAIGYDPQCPPGTLLAAFRLRFRQGAEGPLCDADRDSAARVRQALHRSGPQAG